MKITKIYHKGQKSSNSQLRSGPLKVAAYCRVSTNEESQENSYESQCNYFRKLIEGMKNTKLVGIYGDQGYSGLNSRNREQLQEMLKEARKGNIDLIYVKSISRLARNAIELDEIIQEMNKLGVIIIFEREGIRSNDSQCDLMVKFLAAIAQEESNSLSQAITWGKDKENKMGRPSMACPYGYRKKKRKKGEPHIWEIYEPEANIVRLAYEQANKNIPLNQIVNMLNDRQKEYLDARQRKWSINSLKRLLTSEHYVGDILTNKTYTIDYLTVTRAKNEGNKEQYYLRDHHPAIISRELFEKMSNKYKNGKDRIEQ